MTRAHYMIAAMLLTAVAFAGGMTIAMAQTVTPEPVLVTAVVPHPGLNAFGNIGMDILGWVLSAGVTIVTGFASAWLHKARMFQSNQDESLSSDRLSGVIFRGIDFATVAQQNEAAKRGSGTSEVKYDNVFLSLVSAFVKAGAPDLLTTFGLAGDQGTPRLHTMIMSRLATHVGSPMMAGAIATSSAVTTAKAEGGQSDHFSLSSPPATITAGNQAGSTA